MNKEGKKAKDKKKRKAMVATWSDSDPSSSKSELKIEVKENLCLMAIDDTVYLDDFNDFDKLQNEYECLFDDFEKLRCHNGFSLRLGVTTKIKYNGVAIDLFCTGVIGHPGHMFLN